MKPWFGAHARVAVDTAPLIYFLEGDPRRAPLVRELLKAGANRKVELFVSAVSEAELLVAPLRDGVEGAVEAIRGLLDGPVGIHVFPVNRRVAREAGALRAATNLRLADAIVAATALVTGATALLSNDRALTRLGQRDGAPTYVHLDDLSPPSPAT